MLNIAMLAAIHAVRDTQWPRAALLRRDAYWLAYVAASVVVYALVSVVAVWLRPIDVAYMGKFVDLAGLWGQPLSSLAESASQLRDVLALDPRMFGVTSPWLGLRSPWWAAIASANAAPPVGWRCSRCASARRR